MKHLPWLLLAVVLVYPLFAQGTVGKVSLLSGPLKVYGIPHPDEWIDFESNEAGQPATTYTVPDGHRLTLLAVFKTPPHDTAGMTGQILADGSLLGLVDIRGGASRVGGVERLLTRLEEEGFAGAADVPRHTFVRGTVLMPSQVLTVELTAGSPPQTFTLRGFLERVK